MKDKLFQIFFCIFIFWDKILMSFLGLSGGSLDGDAMRACLVGVFGLSCMFYFLYPKRSKRESYMIILLFLFGALFYSTRYFYDRVDFTSFSLYNGYILRWGSDSVSACLLGMTLTKLRSYSLIHKILPWECLALTPQMAYLTFTQGGLSGQYGSENGFNYQVIAYAMAVLFCITFYYTFIYNREKIAFVKRMLMMGAMMIQAVSCAMSGGRGGLVLLVVYVFYMSYFLLKEHIISKQRLIRIFILSAIGFLVVANYVGLWESAGFIRSSNSLNDQDRFWLWSQYMPYFEANPVLGMGLGGDFFTLMGFYSHNIFVDFLVETGIVGFVTLTTVFYRSYNKLNRLTRSEHIYVIVMILFIYGMVMNMFTSYWIATSIHWMVFGIVMSYRPTMKHYRLIK